MKLTWIICVFITICEAAEIKRDPLTTDPNNENRTHSYLKENSEVTQTTKQNITRPRYSLHTKLSVKHLHMPKTQIKDIFSEDYNSSFVSTTTTRRPLMRNRKFTTKPHAIYYIHSQTHAGQSTFSKRRNSNVKRRIKPQYKTKNTPDSSEDSNSVEDRFKNFTDVGDNINKLGQNKGNISTDRRLHRRRGYPLETAASEQFKSVALYPLQNAEKLRVKSKSAIQESLQKIKNIRPGMKERVMTITPIPSKVKENIESSTINDTEEKTFTTSEKSVQVSIELDESVHITTLSDKLVNSENTSEKAILFTTTTENVEFLNEKKNPRSNSTTEILDAVPSTNLTSGEIVSKEQKLQSSVTETNNSDHLTPTTVELVRSVITTQQLDKSVTEVEIADDSTATVVNLNLSVTNTENPVQSTVKINKLNESTTKTKNFVDSTTRVEKSDNSINETENPAFATDITETSVQSISETEKSMPLIIVTAKSISLSDMKNKIGAITSKIIPSSERTDLNIYETEENLVIMTPSSNEEVITTEGIENHLTQRRKRRINIIEEEKAATTSTGFLFNERETHLDADLTYRNINT